jgi:hypothetical protein
VGASINWIASGGHVNNVTITEIRVYLAEGDELFATYLTEDLMITGAEFDGIVMDGTQVYVSYVYESPTQEGYQDHCNELIEFEIDATYNQGAVLETLTYGGDSDWVNCVNE